MFHHLDFPRLFSVILEVVLSTKPLELLLLQFVVGWPDIFRRLTGLNMQFRH